MKMFLRFSSLVIRGKTAFKNSDPRSLGITAENPNLQNMLSNRALAVVVAVLSGTGADIKKLEDGQTAVNMYLFISIGGRW